MIDSGFTGAPLPWEVVKADICATFGYTFSSLAEEDAQEVIRCWSAYRLYESWRARRKT